MGQNVTTFGTNYIRLILTVLRNVIARQLENTHCSLKTDLFLQVKDFIRFKQVINVMFLLVSYGKVNYLKVNCPILIFVANLFL